MTTKTTDYYLGCITAATETITAVSMDSAVTAGCKIITAATQHLADSANTPADADRLDITNIDVAKLFSHHAPVVVKTGTGYQIGLLCRFDNNQVRVCTSNGVVDWENTQDLRDDYAANLILPLAMDSAADAATAEICTGRTSPSFSESRMCGISDSMIENDDYDCRFPWLKIGGKVSFGEFVFKIRKNKGRYELYDSFADFVGLSGTFTDLVALAAAGRLTKEATFARKEA